MIIPNPMIIWQDGMIKPRQIVPYETRLPAILNRRSKPAGSFAKATAKHGAAVQVTK
jgi:hypothetical protein